MPKKNRFAALRKMWRDLEALPPGERFQQFHRQQQTKPLWLKVAYLALAVVLFGVGVVLAFIPGPAVLFFALSAALLATQSSSIARLLDRAEVRGRRAVTSIRGWWRRRRERRNQSKGARRKRSSAGTA